MAVFAAYAAVFTGIFFKKSDILFFILFQKFFGCAVFTVSVKVKVQVPDCKPYRHNMMFKAAFCVYHRQHPIINGLSRMGNKVPCVSALSQE